MPFQKGKPKTGGRKKGSGNKFMETVKDKCQQLGADPVGIMIEFLYHPSEEAFRFKAAEILMKYMFPIPKEEDHNDIDMRLIEKLKQYQELPKEELIKLTHEEIKRLEDE